MEKKRTIQRASNKKRGRPKVKFNFGVLIIILALSFIGCFAMYMITANIKGDFLDEKENTSITNEEQSSEGTSGNNTETQSNNIKYPIPPSSSAVDASYFKECCMVTDSTLLNISSDKSFMEVIGSAQLNAANCNTMQLSGGSTVCDTIKGKSPKNLYIMLGSDLGTSSDDDMIKGYTNLISDLRSACPDMKIFVMQLPPVKTNTTPVTNALIDDYNGKLMKMAMASEVYCIDTNVILKTIEGGLSSEYSNEDGSLSEKGLKTIRDHILLCTV